MVKLMRMSPVTSLWRPGLNVPVRKRVVRSLPEAVLIAHFDDAGIEGDPFVTAWRNTFSGPEFDLDQTIGLPDILTRLGAGVAYLTGDGVTRFTQANSALNTINGDIDLRCDAALAWESGGTLIAKSTSVGDQRGWRMRHGGTFFEFRYSSDGVDSFTIQSDVPHGLSNFTRHQIRITRDVGSGDVDFYIDAALIDTKPSAPGPIFANTADVEIGAQNDGTAVRGTGQYFSAQALDGIDGSLAVNFSPDEASQTQGDWTDLATLGIWSPQDDAFVNVWGRSVINSSGGSGLGTAVAQLLPSPNIVVMAARITKQTGLNQRIIDSEPGANRQAIGIQGAAEVWNMTQGINVDSVQVDNSGELVVVGVQFTGGASSQMQVSGLDPVIGDAGANNWDFGRILINNSGGDVSIASIGELAILEGTATPEQYQQAVDYMSARWL